MRGASAGDTRLERRACRAPLPTIHRFHDIRKGFEREPRIAHKPYGFVITAYFAAVHVDMGKHGIGGVQRPRVRRVLVGPRAHQQDKIGLLKDGPLMASGRTGAVALASTPSESGCRSSTPPLPITVVATGREKCS